MSASPERLRAAARIVRERGLARGRFEDDEGRVCAYGALRIALAGTVEVDWRVHKWSAFRADESALKDSIDRRQSITKWSDHPDRTADEVAAAFEAAADRLDAASASSRADLALRPRGGADGTPTGLPNGGHEMTTLDETTLDETKTTERTAFTDGLRAVADWLDANPEVALPFPRMWIYCAAYGQGQAVEEGAVFARAPGQCEKSTDEAGNRFVLTRTFGPVSLIWTAIREAVCEKRTVTKTVEEWHCPDSLLREADERAAAGGVA